MSYDIFLIRFKDGRPAPIDAPAFWDLLAGAWQAAPDEHGCVRLVRGDGQADVYATPEGQPTDSVMVNHFGGEAIMDLIVELATESEAVIIGPGLPPLITRAGQEQDLPADVDLGEPVRISAGRELAEAIART